MCGRTGLSSRNTRFYLLERNAMNVARPSKAEESNHRPVNEIVKSEPAPRGFSGEILWTDIREIIRSISLAKLDIALMVKSGPRDGKIIFKGGEIMASICGDLRGREAVSKIKSWKEGYFTLYRIFDGILCRDE
jgi:hypothetical protein